MPNKAMSEWVGWIKLRRFLSFPLPTPAWDYIGHDLAAVWINEDLIYQMSEYGTQTVTPLAAANL